MNLELVNADLNIEDGSKFHTFHSKESKELIYKLKDIDLYRKACFFLAKYDGDFYLLKNRNDERLVGSLKVFKSYSEKKVFKTDNSSIVDREELDKLIRTCYENNENFYVYLEFKY